MECERTKLSYANSSFSTLLYRFRWVFCQLDTLQHCPPPNLRRFLNELPETLDETYEWILRRINKAQKDDAHRLLQCLAVAVRPFRVEELAELLAFDYQASGSGGIPTLKEHWRWDDEEAAVLPKCSSLITIVPSGDSRVVQFSHFSVKEYLTSPRLACSQGDVSRFHVDLKPAHTILAQTCLGSLLQLDDRADNNSSKEFPLVEYAAQHWVDHAQFEGVSSLVRDGMDDLFDWSKPHFAAWFRVHDIDEEWDRFSHTSLHGPGLPLYFSAFCGFDNLTERLIMKNPGEVNAGGGRILAPLPAALYKRHFHIADLLHTHGADLDVRGIAGKTLLHTASMFGYLDIMRWLLDHSADANARQDNRSTPLHLAARNRELEAVQLLLEHNPDVNSQNGEGETPLYEALTYYRSSPGIDIVRRLLEYGTDPNIRDNSQSIPLHRASFRGWLEVVRLLLSYGANVDEKDKDGRTPFQEASENGHHEIAKLLLEHGAASQP